MEDGGPTQPHDQDSGDAGEVVSLERFGASADYQTLFREFGLTTEAVVDAARRSIDRTAD